MFSCVNDAARSRSSMALGSPAQARISGMPGMVATSCRCAGTALRGKEPQAPSSTQRHVMAEHCSARA